MTLYAANISSSLQPGALIADCALQIVFSGRTQHRTPFLVSLSAELILDESSSNKECCYGGAIYKIIPFTVLQFIYLVNGIKLPKWKTLGKLSRHKIEHLHKWASFVSDHISHQNVRK